MQYDQIYMLGWNHTKEALHATFLRGQWYCQSSSQMFDHTLVRRVERGQLKKGATPQPHTEQLC